MRKTKFWILYRRADGSTTAIDKFGTTDDGILAYDQRESKWFCTDIHSGVQVPIPEEHSTTRARAKHYVEEHCLEKIAAFRQTEYYRNCCSILYHKTARFL